MWLFSLSHSIPNHPLSTFLLWLYLYVQLCIDANYILLYSKPNASHIEKKTIWYPYEINTLILMNTGVECRRKRLHNSTRSSALNFHTTKTHTRRMSIYADDFVRAICFFSRFTFIRHRRRLANDGFQTKWMPFTSCMHPGELASECRHPERWICRSGSRAERGRARVRNYTTANMYTATRAPHIRWFRIKRADSQTAFGVKLLIAVCPAAECGAIIFLCAAGSAEWGFNAGFSIWRTI